MRLSTSLLSLAALATIAQGQAPAPTPAKKPVVHHAAATTVPGTLPANIPKVPGIARPLYALRYIDTKLGTGPLAQPSVLGASRADSKVMFYTVQYTGWLAKDGTKFDSSADHPGAAPITFPVGVRQVIPGWDTGFDGMHIGGRRRLFIPWQLAYGAGGRAPVIPAKADLIFDIELVSVSDQPAPSAQPAAPPAQSPTTPSSAPATKPSTTPDPTKPITDPATNDPAKATTPDNAVKPAPKPSTNPPGN